MLVLAQSTKKLYKVENFEFEIKPSPSKMNINSFD